MYRNLAVVQQKIYSYLTRFKNVAFTLIFLRTTTKGPPPLCLPQGPHYPKSTPDNSIYQLVSTHIIINFHCNAKIHKPISSKLTRIFSLLCDKPHMLIIIYIFHNTDKVYISLVASNLFVKLIYR